MKSAILRRALEAGEERVAKVMGRVLATVNLPSQDDVASLRKKLEELEALIDRLAERANRDGGGQRGG